MTDLPDGMVSAKEFVKGYILCDEFDEHTNALEVKTRDAQWRKALDEARGDRNRVMAAMVQQGVALAASQARIAELREALDNLMEWYEGSEPGHNDGHGPGPGVRCAYCVAKSVLSRPTGTQDALRAVCEKVAAEAWNTGWNHALGMGPGDPTGPNGFTEAIVARVLGGSHA